MGQSVTSCDQSSHWNLQFKFPRKSLFSNLNWAIQEEVIYMCCVLFSMRGFLGFSGHSKAPAIRKGMNFVTSILIR